MYCLVIPVERIIENREGVEKYTIGKMRVDPFFALRTLQDFGLLVIAVAITFVWDCFLKVNGDDKHPGTERACVGHKNV